MVDLLYVCSEHEFSTSLGLDTFFHSKDIDSDSLHYKHNSNLHQQQLHNFH